MAPGGCAGDPHRSVVRHTAERDNVERLLKGSAVEPSEQFRSHLESLLQPPSQDEAKKKLRILGFLKIIIPEAGHKRWQNKAF